MTRRRTSASFLTVVLHTISRTFMQLMDAEGLPQEDHVQPSPTKSLPPLSALSLRLCTCAPLTWTVVVGAVPKTIMQLMNVEGLTRENVASHLQKYRLYLRQRFQNEGVAAPSSSDPTFAAGPEPSRAGPSVGPSPGASGEGGGSGDRVARVKGHGMGEYLAVYIEAAECIAVFWSGVQGGGSTENTARVGMAAVS
jgi:hypothetical protein